MRTITGDEEAAIRESIIHGLRSQNWSRIEAENEADARIENLRARHNQSTNLSKGS